MKDYFAKVPVVFDYKAFIGELKDLAAQAKAFERNDCYAKSDVFRKWKHELLDLTTRISRLKYRVNCNAAYRNFDVQGYGSYTERHHQEAFDRDLKDTLVELEVVIGNYERYGDPDDKPQVVPSTSANSTVGKPISETDAKAAPAPGPLEWPPKEKATLLWFAKNMPLSAWTGFFVTLGVVFSAGLTVGHWTSVQGIYSKLAEPPPVPAAKAMPVPVPAKPASK